MGSIIINLDVPQSSEDKASVFFKSCKTIILETNSECFIGNITDIQAFDEKIFIHDKAIAKSLFVFDMEGKFICRIGKFGRGPGEYLSIEDFTINTENNEIYVLDSKQDKLHKYSVSGAFISSIKIDTKNYGSPKSLQYFCGKIYASVQYPKLDDNLLKIIDPASGKILSGYLTMEDNKGYKGGESECGFFNRVYGTPKYTRRFMTSILSLEDMTNPYISFKSQKYLPKKTMVEEINDKNVFELTNALIALPKISDVIGYLETKDFILFQFHLQNRLSTVLYRKLEKTTINIDLMNDLLYKTPCAFRFRCVDNNGAYEVLEMDQFFFGYRELLLDNLDKREQLLALKEESNPVIFYYEFKDN